MASAKFKKKLTCRPSTYTTQPPHFLFAMLNQYYGLFTLFIINCPVLVCTK
jgi:hypothetical protein